MKRLINGSTIVQVAVDTVTYHHIELPCHDVVLAEGLPVESYLDTGDRCNFVNDRDTVRLHPDVNVLAWEALGYAPPIVSGPELDRARRLVNSRAAAMAPTDTVSTRAARPAFLILSRTLARFLPRPREYEKGGLAAAP